MVSNIKKGIAGLVIAGSLVGVTDAQVNSYKDKGPHEEIELAQQLPDEGISKVELVKTQPEIRLKRWGGEIDLGIKYEKVKGSGNRPLLTNRMEWKDGDEEVHAYPLGEENFEIEVVLNKKPQTNVFNFTIEGAEELDFFYQPELTPEEIAEGAFRPDNVIGSYAVYHKTKKDHKVGDTNYATGKAFHIYRPKAIDANGVEEWAALSYTNGILSVEVPQSFLDSATYPVRVDPTFGYTSIGASFALLAHDLRGNAYEAPETGTLDKLTAYLEISAGESSKLGIYIDSTDAFYGGSGEITTESVGAWFDGTMSSETLTSGIKYIILGFGDNTRIAFDITTDVETKVDTYASGYPTFPDPLTPAETTTNNYSIYATYTVEAIAVGETKQSVSLESGTMILQNGTMIYR